MKIDKSKLRGDGLHYSVSLTDIGRKRFPTEVVVDGHGNGNEFQRLKFDMSYAFYRQALGLSTLTITT